MNQTPPELLAPYKAALVAAARDMLRAAGTDGIAIEIPASVPPSVVVLGAEDRIGQLLRAPSREPMLGGRRAGDPPPEVLSWEEPVPGAPRKWTILMTSEGHGLAGALGHKFEHAPDKYERIDVVELGPLVDELASAIEQNAQLVEAVQQMRAALANVRHVGGLMANTMFNLGQKPGTVVDQRLADSMRDMQRDWDAAVRSTPVTDQAAASKEGGTT